MPKQSFADLGVSDAVARALAERGITEPFAVQSLVVADILAGHDVLVASPTGSGKTLAFGVPLVDRIQATAKRPAALVLAPTRELATQIVEETRHVAHARALKIAAVYGGVSLERQAREAAQAHIVVATPGRLEDLLQRRAFSLANVSILVLDEADRMLDMGFRPAVDRIVSQVSRDRQTVFLSATLTGEAGRIAQEYTVDARVHEHRPAPVPRGRDRPPVRRACATPSAWTRCVSELRAERDLALVFVRTKRGADRLVKRLGTQGVEAVAMHGDKSQRQREKALASLRGRPRRHAGGDRRRRARHRRRPHLPRHQLRPARGPRRLHAPRRAHRPRRAQRHRHHVRRRRPGARGRPDRPGAEARRRVRRRAASRPAAAPVSARQQQRRGQGGNRRPRRSRAGSR